MALLDQAILSNDPTFIQRVRTAMIAAAIAISNEGTGVTNHALRDSIAVQALTNPDSMKFIFSAAVATVTAVINDATQNGTVTLTAANSAQQAALVTDADINTAVASIWNSFFNH